jgi:hypothetical protein
MSRRLMWNQDQAEISIVVGSFRCFSDRRHTSLELRCLGKAAGHPTSHSSRLVALWRYSFDDSIQDPGPNL